MSRQESFVRSAPREHITFYYLLLAENLFGKNAPVGLIWFLILQHPTED